MTPSTRHFYHTLSRKAGVVSSAALTLSCDCRNSDGVRVDNPDRVRALMVKAYAELKAFWDQNVGENGEMKTLCNHTNNA